jgi:hypothetical protein
MSFGLEPCHHLASVHSQFDDLEGGAALHRLSLFGRPDGAEPAFTKLLEELVTANERAGALGQLRLLEQSGGSLGGGIAGEKSAGVVLGPDQVLDLALEIADADQRAEYLACACGEDVALRRMVEDGAQEYLVVVHMPRRRS